MSLAPGTRLGPYEITGQIGAGGMGEVYRATDTNLKRTVAIKVLPEAVATDGERLARFQREAEVLARLNHPNIAAIYGLEKSDGTAALVMELVEGPTLADRIAQGPIPVDDALPIAKQIAEAVEAAHEQGIIHRDLKPANVKVRPDGIVKVLDFGLAKALEPVSAGSTDATASPTITSPAMMTRMGVILGTAAYMSPEQAKGRAADKRSDVWAFGCVLFEMVTGQTSVRGGRHLRHAGGGAPRRAGVDGVAGERVTRPRRPAPRVSRQGSAAASRGPLNSPVHHRSRRRGGDGRRGVACLTDPARRVDPGGGRGGGRDRRVHDLLAHQGVGALVAGRAVHHRAPDG